MRKISLIIVGVLISSIMLISCGEKKDDTKLKVGYFPNITHAQALIGKERGDFQKAIGNDTEIDWKEFNAGSAELESLLAGEIDIGYIGPGPAINANTRSKGEVQIIAGVSEAGAVLVSRNESNIKSVSDFKGKTIAVPQFGNTQDLTLRYLFKENNLKDKTKGGDINVVQAENPDIKTLIEKGEIDGALVPEPWGARLEEEAEAQLVLDANSIWNNGNYPVALIVVRKEYLEEHADIVKNFLEAHLNITDYITSNPEESSKLVNNAIENCTGKKLSERIMDKAFKRVNVKTDPNKEAVDKMIDLSLESGFIKEKPDNNKLFNLDILNEIRKERGEDSIL